MLQTKKWETSTNITWIGRLYSLAKAASPFIKGDVQLGANRGVTMGVNKGFFLGEKKAAMARQNREKREREREKERERERKGES